MYAIINIKRFKKIVNNVNLVPHTPYAEFKKLYFNPYLVFWIICKINFVPNEKKDISKMARQISFLLDITIFPIKYDGRNSMAE